MTFAIHSYHRALLSTIFLIVYSSLSLQAQNPFDIKSRIGASKIDSAESLATSENLPHQRTDQTVQGSEEFSANPFDVNKNAIKQKSKPIPPKEIKQDVNTGKIQLSTTTKLIFLGLLFGAFVIIRNMNPGGFRALISMMTNSTVLNQNRLSINGFLNIQLGLFYLFFFLNLSYFIFLSELQGFWQGPFTGFKLYSFVFGVVFAIYLIKYIVLWLIEYAFDIRRAIPNHLFSTSIHNIVLGFALFGINAFFAFTQGGLSKFLLILGIIMIVLIYLWRQFRGFTFMSDIRRFSFFHFFLYLCACEISPLLVIVKLVSS